jgi:hypothetical protein
LRDELAKIHGVRREFQGIFDRYGTKSGWKGLVRTILLLDVEDCLTHKIVTDHLWFNETKGFAANQLQQGDVVRFHARVTRYVKGYRGRRDEDFDDRPPVELDYRLSFPTKLTLLPRVHQSTDDSAQTTGVATPTKTVLTSVSTVQQAQLTKWFR